ncbi:MAG: hypothetical protein GY866_32770 [Proteobacteria bacterium]|nr:hypothetical protein [Pseudomonadota bacterium]
MALFGIFSKVKKSAERKYFEQRKMEDEPEGGRSDEKIPGWIHLSDRIINKDLYVGLFRLMKQHDANATISIFANTTDTIRKETGIMINKGQMPIKIISYLQNTRLNHLDTAFKMVKQNPPDGAGFFLIEDRVAAKLNLPANVLIYPILHKTKSEFGMILVFKKTLKDRGELAKKIIKAIRK